jgi:hypothetical protein
MIITKIQGGLGNQLFQYATGRALSIRNKSELKLDLSFFENPEYQKVYRLDKFNLPFTVAKDSEFNHLKNVSKIPFHFRILKRLGIKVFPYYKKSNLLEDEILTLSESKNLSNRDYYLEGWFSNPNYFNEIRGIILKEFNADQLLSPENIVLQKEVLNSNSVAVHIRRKDYLANHYFTTLPKEYYIKSIEQLVNEINSPTFYFFSDDISWVKEQFKNIQKVRFVACNSNSETAWNTIGDISDLMLMRTCKHQIIANSTFSWWAGWLNENPSKLVLFPAIWYNDVKAQKKFETNSFMPTEWIKIQFTK